MNFLFFYQLIVLTHVVTQVISWYLILCATGTHIAEVLEKLRSPADPRKPGEAWSALKGLQLKLQQRVTKRSSYSLHMRDISPTLAEMRDTQISMPGMRSVLTIAVIQDHIAVLPTKTKPKKLVFQGSDGKS